ncbi:MAG: amino acid transporter [Acidobacteria bacterium]|nr:MAG: amino acid transporter [Acidobacteriota bacterium]
MADREKPEGEETRIRRLRRIVIGKARNVSDPEIFHHTTLIAFLAWVGLGADGLSSSAYGPEEAYKALGAHNHLAIILTAMTAITIAVISTAYSNLIEYFPGGGGGYLVATKMLGNRVGVVSGCALLVDYVLTITVSIANGCDQIWSFLPLSLLHYKLIAEIIIIILLVVLNLRGVKESVTFLMPIFVAFLIMHAILIVYTIGRDFGTMPQIFHGAARDFHASAQSLGWLPLMLLILRAYSLGGGTYTGIEAVSNGVSILREPRVATARKTMLLMATSLAFTAGGIMFSYLLTNSHPVPGRTMNAVLLGNVFGTWPMGKVLVIFSLVTEAALLFVAAQAGFLDGPRILSNMAIDSWMPHRFSQLSDRLVTQDGILMMGLAALAALLYTRGDVTIIVVMYSINVFITFSLSLLGMSKHFIQDRDKESNWKPRLLLHGIGFLMCASILGVTIFEKFASGGWITIAITGVLIGIAFAIHKHYRRVSAGMKSLDDVLKDLPPAPGAEASTRLDKNVPTAVIMVKSFSGFGIHEVLSIHRLFPRMFKNFIFVSAAVVDSGSFKGAQEIESLEDETRSNLQKYVAWAQGQGMAADYRIAIGTEAVDSITEVCRNIAEEYPRAIFFMGRLIFREEKWYYRLLHNETPNAIQRRLQFDGLQAIVLPIRVLQS